MKNLKAKLTASVGMLLVAIIMMSTASYAWFTISTTPEISNVTANIAANGNLEIALGNKYGDVPSESDIDDSGKNTAWGNLIDLSNAFVASGTNVIMLKPVRFTVTTATDKASFVYPVYGKDGRVATMSSLTDVRASSTDAKEDFRDVEGVKYFVSTYTNLGNNTISVTYSDVYAFGVEYWLRSNSTPTDASTGKIHVFLASASDRASGSDMEAGLGSYILGDAFSAITVAFHLGDSTGKWFIASRTNIVTDSDTKANLVLRKATVTDKGLLVMDTTDTEEAYFDMDPNTATKVMMYVYMNGDGVKNSDAALAIAGIKLNVQFEIPDLAEAMYVRNNGENGRY